MTDSIVDPDSIPHVRGKSRRLWPYALAAGTLVVALTGVTAALVYSVHSANAWRDSSNQKAAELASTRKQRDELDARLKSVEGNLAFTQTKLADTTAKFNEASDRIRSLANEKAQVGDAAAELAEAVVLSRRVTLELNSCVTQLQELQVYIVNYESYDWNSLVAYAQGVNDDCSRAKADNATLAARLDSL